MARRFNFRFDSLLLLRELQRKAREIQVWKANTNLMSAKSEAEVLFRDQVIFLNEFKNSVAKSFSVESALNLADYNMFLSKKIKDSLESVRQKSTELSLKRNELKDALKKERLLGKLKAERKNINDKERQKEETFFLDEIASSAYIRH